MATANATPAPASAPAAARSADEASARLGEIALEYARLLASGNRVENIQGLCVLSAVAKDKKTVQKALLRSEGGSSLARSVPGDEHGATQTTPACCGPCLGWT